MERSYYLGLAEAGLRLPIGTHLVLHEAPDPAAVELDGERHGDMIVRSAGSRSPARSDTHFTSPISRLSHGTQPSSTSVAVPTQSA